MAQIKDYSAPKYLYRYRSVVPNNLEREIGTITERYLWCSPLLELNDPMEGLYAARQKTSRYEANEVAYDRLRQIKLDRRICSFSQTFDNQIMWAHYTGQFKGICVEYRVKDMLSSLPEDVSLVRMYYTNRPPPISNEDLESGSAADKIISHKSRSWEYELEWRIITKTSKLLLSSRCVERIFVGSRFDSDNLRCLQTALQGTNIPILQMIVDGYRIKFEPAPLVLNKSDLG